MLKLIILFNNKKKRVPKVDTYLFVYTGGKQWAALTDWPGTGFKS